MKRLVALLGIMALIVWSAVISEAQSNEKQTIIRVAGAHSMFFRVERLGKQFSTANPSIKVDVTQGGTVESGLRAIIGGHADLAMASRVIMPEEDKLAEEKGVKLVERVIGYGGIAIIVNAATRVDRLTVSQVIGLLTGAYSNWKEVGGADAPVQVVRTDEAHPGTLAFLQLDVLKKPFSPQALLVSSFPSAVSKVADAPGAIGYVRIREITESPELMKDLRVKAVPISSFESTVPVMPSRETVADRSYPLVRPYIVYYVSTVKTEVITFVDYLVKNGWGPQDK